MKKAIWLIFLYFVCGCTSTTTDITREYLKVDHISKADAASILQDAQCRIGGSFFKISSVNELNFTYGRKETIEDSRRVAGFTIDKIIYDVEYHYEGKLYGVVFFANIEQIKLVTKDYFDADGENDGARIKLLLKSGRTFDIICANKVGRYNKLISALLVLCPNVK